MRVLQSLEGLIRVIRLCHETLSDEDAGAPEVVAVDPFPLKFTGKALSFGLVNCLNGHVAGFGSPINFGIASFAHSTSHEPQAPSPKLQSPGSWMCSP